METMEPSFTNGYMHLFILYQMFSSKWDLILWLGNSLNHQDSVQL